MAKSWLRRHRLAYVLIASLIFGFVLYLDIGKFFICLVGTVLGGLLAYKLLLPLVDKLMDPYDAWVEKLLEKLRKRWEVNREN